MTGFIDWIAAQDDELPTRPAGERDSSRGSSTGGSPWRKFPQPGRPTGSDLVLERCAGNESSCDPELSFYRHRTVSLLRRYQRLSLETGRLPSIVGKEFFRTTITRYRSATFEDRVIFVRDVEKALSRLEYWDQQLVARVILQEHNYDRAAYLLHCSRKTIQRRVPEVLDLLSEYFLQVGLLVAFSSEQ
jgi:phage-related protein